MTKRTKAVNRAGAPLASIVIPTHNRAASLAHVLDALARQTCDMSVIEVIVVSDGSTDETLEMLRKKDWGLRLKVVDQAQSGVAAARNRGAAEASAPLLVFIDDDVAPAPGFVVANLKLQADAGPCVALGRLAASDLPGANPPGWWRWLEWQFDKQYEEMLSGERIPDGHVLYSGNFCLPTQVFRDVGGFDESVRYCEDSDLGLRLLQASIPFRFNSDAVGHHSGYRSYKSWLDAAYHGGFWDAGEILKMSKAFMLGHVVHEYNERHALLRKVADVLLGRPRLFSLGLASIRGVAIVAGWLRLRKLERYAYGGIYDLVHWQGVCDGLGGVSLLRRYLEAPQLNEVAA
jgi:GT2 family glycosyltransferase